MKQAFWLGTLIVTALAAINPTQAQVRCGDELDSDGPAVVVLTRDLLCGGDSSDEAVTVDGPVTLEMRGHSITCVGDRNDGIDMTGTRARLIDLEQS